MRKTLLQLIKTPAPANAEDAWQANGEPAELVESAPVTIRCYLTGPQPASGKDLEELEEGERDRAVFKFYIDRRQARPSRGDEITGAPADVILWDGRRYKVISVAPFTAPLGTAKIMMTLEDGQEV